MSELAITVSFKGKMEDAVVKVSVRSWMSCRPDFGALDFRSVTGTISVTKMRVRRSYRWRIASGRIVNGISVWLMKNTSMSKLCSAILVTGEKS